MAECAASVGATPPSPKPIPLKVCQRGKVLHAIRPPVSGPFRQCQAFHQTGEAGASSLGGAAFSRKTGTNTSGNVTVGNPDLAVASKTK